MARTFPARDHFERDKPGSEKTVAIAVLLQNLNKDDHSESDQRSVEQHSNLLGRFFHLLDFAKNPKECLQSLLEIDLLFLNGLESSLRRDRGDLPPIVVPPSVRESGFR
jgi:hypothetical protein